MAAVLRLMGPELKIREDETEGSSSRTRRLWVLSAAAVVAVVSLLGIGLLLWKFMPGNKPTARPFEAQGLKLVDTTILLPTASFKLVDFSLPCAGTLSLELTCKDKNTFDVFVVPPEEIAKMNAKQTFKRLDGFDAQFTEEYLRTASVPPGKYCLVVMDKSPSRLGSSRTLVHVRARLNDLN